MQNVNFKGTKYLFPGHHSWEVERKPAAPPHAPPLPKDGCSVLPLTALFALGINWHGCRVPWALGAQWIHSLLAPAKQVVFWVGAVCKALCVLVLTENSSCVPGCSDEDAICKQEGL